MAYRELELLNARLDLHEAELNLLKEITQGVIQKIEIGEEMDNNLHDRTAEATANIFLALNIIARIGELLTRHSWVTGNGLLFLYGEALSALPPAFQERTELAESMIARRWRAIAEAEQR